MVRTETSQAVVVDCAACRTLRSHDNTKAARLKCGPGQRGRAGVDENLQLALRRIPLWRQLHTLTPSKSDLLLHLPKIVSVKAWVVLDRHHPKLHQIVKCGSSQALVWTINRQITLRFFLNSKKTRKMITWSKKTQTCWFSWKTICEKLHASHLSREK